MKSDAPLTGFDKAVKRVESRGGRFQPTHGLGHSVFHNRYYAMRNRCKNPKNNRYHLYGAKGIKCEWTTFQDFMDDMYKSYLKHVKKFGEKETQLDRIDPTKNYNKENCRWVNLSEQARNRTNIKRIIFNGKSQLLSDWTKELGLNFSRPYQRIYMYGWTVEDAFTHEKHINQFL